MSISTGQLGLVLDLTASAPCERHKRDGFHPKLAAHATLRPHSGEFAMNASLRQRSNFLHR